MPHTHQPHIHVDNQPSTPSSQERLVQPLDEVVKPQVKTMKILIPGVYILLVLLGIGTGYLLASRVGGRGWVKTAVIKTEKEVGISDTRLFPDSAEGIIEKNGIDGEGTHKLIREGGPSQTAYLTSSVVDLDQFVDLKVRVWGETFAAKRAGWLMDVGKVEILK